LQLTVFIKTISVHVLPLTETIAAVDTITVITAAAVSFV